MAASTAYGALPPPHVPEGAAGPMPASRKSQFDRTQLAGLLPAAAIIVPLSILALGGWLAWRAVWDDARSEMLRAARSAAEYGARTLESYNVAAGRLNDRLRGLTDADIRQREGSLHRELQRMGAELSQADVAYVIDRNGFPLLASSTYTKSLRG